MKHIQKIFPWLALILLAFHSPVFANLSLPTKKQEFKDFVITLPKEAELVGMQTRKPLFEGKEKMVFFIYKFALSNNIDQAPFLYINAMTEIDNEAITTNALRDILFSMVLRTRIESGDKPAKTELDNLTKNFVSTTINGQSYFTYSLTAGKDTVALFVTQKDKKVYLLKFVTPKAMAANDLLPIIKSLVMKS